MESLNVHQAYEQLMKNREIGAMVCRDRPTPSGGGQTVRRTVLAPGMDEVVVDKRGSRMIDSSVLRFQTLNAPEGWADRTGLEPLRGTPQFNPNVQRGAAFEPSMDSSLHSDLLDGDAQRMFAKMNTKASRVTLNPVLAIVAKQNEKYRQQRQMYFGK